MASGTGSKHASGRHRRPSYRSLGDVKPGSEVTFTPKVLTGCPRSDAPVDVLRNNDYGLFVVKYHARGHVDKWSIRWTLPNLRDSED